MANRYVEIQNYHNAFFRATERSFLVSFTILVLHPFDSRTDSYSLYIVDKGKTDYFVKKNESVIDALRTLRNKLFAHRDKDLTPQSAFTIPSVINMDKFFEDLIILYNELTGKVDGSMTDFMFAKDIKLDMERLLMNLYRGEAVRLKEIHVEWDWAQSNKKASDIL